jgi:hypothetical protein
MALIAPRGAAHPVRAQHFEVGRHEVLLSLLFELR